MEKIQRLPDAGSTPQPVGRGHRTQPGRDQDAFREILDRKQRQERERREEAPAHSREETVDEARRPGEESEPPDEARGRLLDERA